MCVMGSTTSSLSDLTTTRRLSMDDNLDMASVIGRQP
jgi:hypothetical protein